MLLKNLHGTYSVLILKYLDKVERFLEISGLVVLLSAPIYTGIKMDSWLAFGYILVLLSPILFMFYIKKLNVFTTSLFVLFAIPIALSSILLFFTISIFQSTFSNLGFFVFYLNSLPLMTIATCLSYNRKKNFSSILRVSLEYNGWIYSTLIFIYFILSAFSKDFTLLLPTVSPEIPKRSTLENLRELSSTFLQIASFPFLITNGILKALIEHQAYRSTICD